MSVISRNEPETLTQRDISNTVSAGDRVARRVGRQLAPSHLGMTMPSGDRVGLCARNEVATLAQLDLFAAYAGWVGPRDDPWLSPPGYQGRLEAEGSGAQGVGRRTRHFLQRQACGMFCPEWIPAAD